MKRKILLGVLIAAVAMCLFAISISATEIDGVHYSLNDSQLTAEVSRDNKTATTEIVTITSSVPSVSLPRHSSLSYANSCKESFAA